MEGIPSTSVRANRKFRQAAMGIPPFRKEILMSAIHTGTVVLAERSSDGTTVTLAHDFNAGETLVSVDSKHGNFTLYPPNPVALDCYYHPFAYADRVLTRGTFAEVS